MSRFLRYIIRFMSCALLVGLMACDHFKRETEVYVPLQKSAREQYVYAVQYRDGRDLLLRNKKQMGRLVQSREAVRKTFEFVIENFPEDREVTPMAKLEIADMKAGLDRSRLTPTANDLREAIADFQKIQEDYPESEAIQAKARFDEGKCWLSLKEYEKAQGIFRDLMDNYRESKDPDVIVFVKLANDAYQQTYVK